MGERLTLDAYISLIEQPGDKSHPPELIDGYLSERPRTADHIALSARLTIQIGARVERLGLGRSSVWTPCVLDYSAPTVYIPDIAFIRQDRLPAPLDPATAPHIIHAVPDLAVHIKTPDEGFKAVRSRADRYLRYGVRTMWLVYPAQKLVEVHTPEDFVILTMDDVLSGAPALPDFTLSVRELFETQEED